MADDILKQGSGQCGMVSNVRDVVQLGFNAKQWFKVLGLKLVVMVKKNSALECTAV